MGLSIVNGANMIWKPGKLQRKNKWALFDVEVLHKSFVAGPYFSAMVEQFRCNTVIG